jgi:hypothetical protein
VCVTKPGDEPGGNTRLPRRPHVPSCARDVCPNRHFFPFDSNPDVPFLTHPYADGTTFHLIELALNNTVTLATPLTTICPEEMTSRRFSLLAPVPS